MIFIFVKNVEFDDSFFFYIDDSILIHLATIKKKKLSPQIFAKMSRLQFLENSAKYNDDLFDQLYLLAEGLEFFTTELRFLYWANYPLKSLPEIFSAKNLVILTLQDGNMEKLWNGVKNLVSLKDLDLNSSEKLKELLDLSKQQNL
ncbi:Disease resistance protein TAO1, partial [Mucuna pruriens]